MTTRCVKTLALSFLAALAFRTASLAGEALIVVDKSGSMSRKVPATGQSRLDAVRSKVLEEVERHLTTGEDRVWISFFDTEVTPSIEVRSIGEAEALFAGKSPGGKTNIWDAMMGILPLVSSSEADIIHMSLYTDGDHTVPSSRYAEKDVLAAFHDYFDRVEKFTIFNFFQWDWGKTDLAPKKLIDEVRARVENQKVAIHTDSESAPEVLRVVVRLPESEQPVVFRRVPGERTSEPREIQLKVRAQPASQLRQPVRVAVEGSRLVDPNGRKWRARLLAPEALRIAEASESQTISMRVDGLESDLPAGVPLSGSLSFRPIDDPKAFFDSCPVEVILAERSYFNVVRPGRGDPLRFRAPAGTAVEVPIVIDWSDEPGPASDPPVLRIRAEPSEGLRTSFATGEGAVLGSPAGFDLDLSCPPCRGRGDRHLHPRRFTMRLEADGTSGGELKVPLSFEGLERREAREVRLELEPARLQAHLNYNGSVFAAEFRPGAWRTVHPQALVLQVDQEFALKERVRYRIVGAPQGVEARLITPGGRSSEGELDITKPTLFLGLEYRLADVGVPRRVDRWDWGVRFEPIDGRKLAIPQSIVRLPSIVPQEPAFSAALGTKGAGAVGVAASKPSRVPLVVSWNKSADGQVVVFDGLGEQDGVRLELREIDGGLILRPEEEVRSLPQERSTTLVLDVSAAEPLTQETSRTLILRGKGLLNGIVRRIDLGLEPLVAQATIELQTPEAALVVERPVEIATFEVAALNEAAAGMSVRLEVPRIPGAGVKILDELARDATGKPLPVPPAGRASRYTIAVETSYELFAAASRERRLLLEFRLLPEPGLLVDGKNGALWKILAELRTPRLEPASAPATGPIVLRLERTTGKARQVISTASLDGFQWAVRNLGAGARGRAAQEVVTLRCEPGGLFSEIRFAATGTPSATVEELLANPHVELVFARDAEQGLIFDRLLAMRVGLESGPALETRPLELRFEVASRIPGGAWAAAGLLGMLGCVLVFGIVRYRRDGEAAPGAPEKLAEASDLLAQEDKNAAGLLDSAGQGGTLSAPASDAGEDPEPKPAPGPSAGADQSRVDEGSPRGKPARFREDADSLL